MQIIKKLLKQLFLLTGVYVVKKARYKGRVKFNLGDLCYDAIIPHANYAPWLADDNFQAVYQKVKAYTMVDQYRCYELWELAGKLHQMDPAASFIEIGVWKGGSSAIIAAQLALLQSTSILYLADTFKGVAKTSDKDSFYNGGEHADTTAAIATELVINEYKNVKILEGIFPDETGCLIPEGDRFSFCHIDVDVYDSAKGIIDWIWPRLIIGGTIIFDDYGFHTCDGVTRFVNEQKVEADRIVFHNLNGHALMVKIR